MAKFRTVLDMCKNTVENAVFQKLDTPPTNPVDKQYYFDTVKDELRYWDATEKEWMGIGAKGPIVLRGTIGTGGTITALPLNKTAKVGDAYQVITDADYIKKTGATQTALVGDLFVCVKKGSEESSTDAEWEYIPSGNDKNVVTFNGDGTKKEFDVVHKLNTQDVSVKVMDGATREVIITDVKVKDEHTVTIGFGIAPEATESFIVEILC